MQDYRKIPLFWLLSLFCANILLFTSPDGSSFRVIGAVILILLPGLVWQRIIPADRLTRWLVGVGISYFFIVVTNLLLLYGAIWPTLQTQMILYSSLTLIGIIGCYFPRPIFFPLHSSKPVPARETILQWGLLLVILMVATFFRLANLEYSEFLEDEGEVMLAVAHISNGELEALFENRRKGPTELLLPLSMWAMTGIITEGIARFLFGLAGIFAIVTMYLLGREMVNPTVGLVAAMLFALSGFNIAFSRIVQYQIMVLWMSCLAMFCGWCWYQSGRKRWLILAGLFFSIGLLAHYDVLFIVPPLLYLVITRKAYQTQKQAVGLALIGVLVVVTLYFGPYVLSPQLDHTTDHLASRIGTELIKNRLADFVQYNIIYNSVYYFILTGLFVFGGLAISISRWSFWQSLPYRFYWFPLLLVCLIVVVMTTPTILALTSTIDLTVFLFGFIFLGAGLAPQITVTQRLLVLWCAIPFLGYNFGVDSPRTHIYTIVPAWTLLAAMSMVAIIHFNRWLLLPIGLMLGLTIIFLYLVYINTSQRYWQTWPDGTIAQYFAPAPPQQADEQPHFFGFVHRTGWKTIGGLYSTGVLNGSYQSNESNNLVAWYTFNAPYEKEAHPPEECHPRPTYFLLGQETLAPPGRVDEEHIATHYEELLYTDESAMPRVTVYHLKGNEANLPPFSVLDMEYKFDQLAKPAMFRQAEPQNFSTQINFSNIIELVRYTLNPQYPRPNGRIIVRLHWASLQQISEDWQVSVQLIEPHSGQIVGQSNNHPVCGYYPTSQWQPGQTIPDEHILNLAPDIPLGLYQLQVILVNHDTNKWLPWLNSAGEPQALPLKLTDLTLSEWVLP
ncbi:glycosyltransferase family 39 protein [Anaerolineales bacterium HSG24]|nr:glycosyltransferase family 39 protein [Anaerolineales bacterium HSG24]